MKDADAIVFVVDDDLSVREAIRVSSGWWDSASRPSKVRKNSCEANDRTCPDAWCSMWSYRD